MNGKLQEERESMVMEARWGVVWIMGKKWGFSRLTTLTDIDPIFGDRKYIYLERIKGNRLPASLFRYAIDETIKRSLSVPESEGEPIEYKARPSGGYRIWSRTGSRRSIRVDRHEGVHDFLLPADDLSRLLFWFDYHKPEHIKGEDVAVYAL